MFVSSTAASFFDCAEPALLSVAVAARIRVTRNTGLAGYRFTVARKSERLRID